MHVCVCTETKERELSSWLNGSHTHTHTHTFSQTHARCQGRQEKSEEDFDHRTERSRALNQRGRSAMRRRGRGRFLTSVRIDTDVRRQTCRLSGTRLKMRIFNKGQSNLFDSDQTDAVLDTSGLEMAATFRECDLFLQPLAASWLADITVSNRKRANAPFARESWLNTASTNMHVHEKAAGAASSAPEMQVDRALCCLPREQVITAGILTSVCQSEGQLCPRGRSMLICSAGKD